MKVPEKGQLISRRYPEKRSQQENSTMLTCSVGGVIAAASRKVARPFLQIGTISVIRRIVITFQQAGIFPITVITGADEEEVRRQLAGFGVIFLPLDMPDDQPELFASARLGLSFLQDKCRRILFAPVNVPMFTPDTVMTLLESQADVAVPSFEGKGGHPVLIRTEAVSDILAYKGQDGLRGALSGMGGSRVWIPVQDRGVLLNVRNEDELMGQLKEHNASIIRPVLHMKMEGEAPFLTERLKLLLFLIGYGESLRKGCQLIGISYSKAWEMIAELERNLGYAVVSRRHGGKGGGMTALTQDGIFFLKACQKYDECVRQNAQKMFGKYFVETGIIR